MKGGEWRHMAAEDIESKWWLNAQPEIGHSYAPSYAQGTVDKRARKTFLIFFNPVQRSGFFFFILTVSKTSTQSKLQQ